jgi:tRNA dimethylallyltransferase
MPDVPATVRAETMALQAALGNPAFHAALEKIDPVMAARLHPNDTQRLIRAYEIRQATGRSLDHWQSLPREGAPASWRFHITLVLPERETLYGRCNRRFDLMLENGALEEIIAFNERATPDDAPIKHALGYRPLTAFLNGRIGREEAADLGKTETRQYAKRQVTWFRHQVKPGGTVASLETVS